MKTESDKNDLEIIFEYTAAGTPQQNGVVERAFVTFMGHARAMMNHAGFTMAKRQQLWCEATQNATLLDNILVQDSSKGPLLLIFLEWMQSMPSIQKVMKKCVLWQIQIIKWGGPKLIQEEKLVYLLGTILNMQEMSTDS